MLSHTDRDMQSQYVQPERAAHYHDICMVEKRLLLLKQWEQRAVVQPLSLRAQDLFFLNLTCWLYDLIRY